MNAPVVKNKSTKKIAGTINLLIPVGKATPAPPIGPALAQKQVSIPEFIKQFNERTKHMEPGTPTPVLITAYADKSFDFIIKLPPVSYLICKHAGIAKGLSNAGREKGPNVSMDVIRKVAEMKKDEMKIGLDSAINCVKGTAKSMGFEVVESND